MTAQASAQVHFIFLGKATSFTGFIRLVALKILKEDRTILFLCYVSLRHFGLLDVLVLLDSDQFISVHKGCKSL